MCTHLLHEDKLSVDGDERPKVRKLLKPEILVFDGGLVPGPALRGINVRTETVFHNSLRYRRVTAQNGRVSNLRQSLVIEFLAHVDPLQVDNSGNLKKGGSWR